MRRYFWNILVALDQLVNVLFGGDPDETISSRWGRAVARDRCVLCRFACWVLDRFDPGHCQKSIEK